MPFASSWHNVVLLELSTLFVKLRLIFVSFSHFSLNFCIVSFPFFAYNKLNTTFRTDSSPPGDPWKEFYHMKHSKKLVTLSVLTTMSGAAIYFLNKTLDTAAVRKNLLASAEKEIFSWQFGDIFYTKKGTGTPMLLLHDLHCASSGREWQYIEDTLAKDHTVYTLDLLGCGRSDKPAITYTNFL